MRETVNNHALNCDFKEQLVTYLYDEASPIERQKFEQHLNQCRECRTELHAFKGVREDLGAWQMPFVPPIEITTPRRAGEILRELLSVIPAWLKVSSGLVATAAAALLVFSLAGTRISYGQNGFDVAIGKQPISQVTQSNQNTSGGAVKADAPTLTRAEAEALINAAVEHAQAQSRQEASAQMASLEARLNATHRAELIEATNKLRNEHQRRWNTLLAERQRPTINEWLFAANDSAEPVGADNEKNN